MIRKKAGFTLVEMMVVIVLVSILTLGIVGMFITMIKGQTKTKALADIKSEGDYITTRLERAIRDGKSADELTKTITKKAGSPTVIDFDAFNKVVIIDTTAINSGKYELLNYAGIDGTAPSFQVFGTKKDRVLIQFALKSTEANVMVPFSVYVYLRNSD